MDFGIILGDIPTTVSEKDHFDSILRQVEAAQRAGMNHILMGQHFIFERSTGCSRCRCWPGWPANWTRTSGS